MFSRSCRYLLVLLPFLLAAQRVPHRPSFVPDRYVLLLEDSPVAQRFASREQLRTAAAVNYRQQIELRQQQLRRELISRKITVTGSVSTVLNAVYVSAPADRLDELKSLPGVAGVRPMRRLQRHLNRAVQLMNGPAAWAAFGGQQNGGTGMKIAIIDSGIDQTHPAFQDTSLTPPAGFPKCNAVSDCLKFTNNKVIVARSYVPWIANADPSHPDPTVSTPDDYSARDRDGHGTAVASAAAGNINTGSITFSGMAPKAFVGAYKVYGSPGVNDGPPESVFQMAIEDAVKDGMDVAVFSSGYAALSGALDSGPACGLTGTAPCDPLAAAFENAAKSLVIVVSAGNDGENSLSYPNYTSISSPAHAPSVIGVGATTNSHVMAPTVSVNSASAPSNLKNIAAQLGDSASSLSMFSVAIAQSAPLVDVSQLGDDGAACSTLPPDSLKGAFALIRSGGPASCTLDFKTGNAQDAGAIGAILYMSDSSTPVAPIGVDGFFGPVVMLSNGDGLALQSYIAAHKGGTVTIDLAGAEQDIADYGQSLSLSPPLAGNQLASYSSLGPSTGSYAMKPDLVATGGLDPSLIFRPEWPYDFLPVLEGMYLAGQTFDPLGFLYSSSGYVAASGTSFSAPITGGAAALVKQKNPNFTSAQVRSALVNSAAQDVTVDDFGDPVDPQWYGGGRLDAGAAVNAIVTAEPATISLGALQAGSAPKPVAVKITNQSAAPVTLAVGVSPVVGGKVSTVAVDQNSITLAAGASTTLNVSLSGAVPPAGAYSGAVTLQGSGISMRIPYFHVVGSGNAYNLTFPVAAVDGIAGRDLGWYVLGVTDEFGVAVPNSSVRFSVSPRGSLTFQSVPGEPACAPASSTSAVVCPTDSYGFAYVDVVAGSNTGFPKISVSGAGSSAFPVDVTIRQQPTITATGPVNGAQGDPVAPGGDLAIYGSGLSDFTDEAGPFTMTSDGSLPLSLDSVTVSFDVPSAGLSLPGGIESISPNQVNVRVPKELQGQSSVQVKVTVNESEFGNVVTLPLSAAAASTEAQSVTSAPSRVSRTRSAPSRIK